MGGLVICGLVYAELLARPGLKAAFLDDFLRSTEIVVDYELPREILVLAAAAQGTYSLRRRISGAGEPRRMLTDFIIGAHATRRADRLITFNQKDFRTSFPNLVLVPESS